MNSKHVYKLDAKKFITKFCPPHSVKETFVEGELDENNSPEMLKMCTFYTDQERHWLLDRSFSVSFVINACTMIFGFMSMFVLLMSSTRPLKVDAFRTMSVGFGINAILNMSPLLILLKSNVCTDRGICDDSQTNCVSGCELSTGSWQVLATSVMWISAMISSWVISPAQIDLDGRPHGHGKTKGAKDEESQKTVSCSRSSSFESGRSKEDDEENS